MKKILVATDFSPRSDRAIRRGVLLAKDFGASLTLLHVVDNDQPDRIVQAKREAATALLSEQAASLSQIDGISCDYSVFMDAPFAGIQQAVKTAAPDVLLIGPHRRQALRDIFVGTTAERTIRSKSAPVLMANGVPASGYRHALVAVDFSDCSRDAMRAVVALGLKARLAISVIHVLDNPAAGPMSKAPLTEAEARDYVMAEEKRAAGELTALVFDAGLAPAKELVRLNDRSAADIVCATAKEIGADLIVVGTHGRSGLSKLMLGSVAQEILSCAEVDVLAVPPRA
ncbi:universal stress protein [uncultured Ferrovibrio sp.]|jgi:nucleotide-binding universal stress UspA family protein|uniref:universal stress protein n=1 Tax=uncultured Ferrovibrio sp. TaxID=1576913 RepID=UPI00261FD84F|nr:universal stress protein [uncultured Ferrovibrio sp.]